MINLFNKHRVLIVIVLSVLVTVALYYFWDKHQDKKVQEKVDATDKATRTINISVNPNV